MSMEEAWRAPYATACLDEVLPNAGADSGAIQVARASVYLQPHHGLQQRICAHIEANLGDESLGIASLIDAFGVSRSTLCRLFGSEGGVGSYIRRRRLERARSYLMSDPACSITWLLYELGFASERQFQRAFHARYGISPAQWRKCCRSESPTVRRHGEAGHSALL
jgi:AraC-like DNA-binding protein